MGRSLNTFQAEDLFYFAADPDPERIPKQTEKVEPVAAAAKQNKIVKDTFYHRKMGRIVCLLKFPLKGAYLVK